VTVIAIVTITVNVTETAIVIIIVIGMIVGTGIETVVAMIPEIESGTVQEIGIVTGVPGTTVTCDTRTGMLMGATGTIVVVRTGNMTMN